MKTRLQILFVSAVFAVAGSARAQVVTYETISQWSGSVITLTSGQSYAQTFSNVLQVESMTYKFASYNNTSSSATTFSAAFVEWNVGSNTAGALVQNLGTINLPPSNTWTEFTTFTVDGEDTNIFTYELPITLNAITSASTTYALVLTANQQRNNLGFTLTNNNAFNHGHAVGYSAFDWGFSQIAVEPAPIPEASTVVSLMGVCFAAGLVGLRLRQRRQLAAAPGAQLTA